MNQVNLNKYKEFVLAVTSETSKDLTAMMNRLDQMDANYEAYGPNGEMMHGPDINVPLILTSAMGLTSETGEFMEILKKCMWQGKPLNEDNVFHMKRELGDIIFYWINACTALKLDPNAVIQENIDKLSKRYPTGHFEVNRSENRKPGDL